MRRARLIASALGLVACAAVPEPIVLDADAQGRLTVEGFREASPLVAARLDAAVAWAVFPDVEDTREECVHTGRLFQPGAAPRPAELRCAVRPSAPAGAAYHVLVILEDPADLTALAAADLELADAPHLMPHDDHEAPASSAKVWVVTTALGGVLFDAWRPRQTLRSRTTPPTRLARPVTDAGVDG